MEINNLPSRTLHTEGGELLFFSGTSYLGIGHNTAFRAALIEGIERYGTTFSVSRNNNLKLDIYAAAERYLAKLTRAQAALTMSSGMLAGQTVVKTCFLQHKFYTFPRTHPAIWQNSAPPKVHNLFAETGFRLAKLATNEVLPKHCEGIVIAFNSVDPLFCEPYSWEWIEALPTHRPITLLCDDSHGFGLLGTEGGGIFETLSKRIEKYQNISLVVTSSLGKALGVSGGVILGSSAIVEAVRKSPVFGGASPIAPAYLWALMRCEDVYTQCRAILFQNIQYFKNKIPKDGTFQWQLPLPVFYTKKNDLYDFLLKQKIWISHFAYPSPTDAYLTRIILSSLHTQNDLDTLIEAIGNYKLTT